MVHDIFRKELSNISIHRCTDSKNKTVKIENRALAFSFSPPVSFGSKMGSSVFSNRDHILTIIVCF